MQSEEGDAFTSKEATGIEGTLLMLDDATPHVAVPVQAICDGKVTATTLSSEHGKYQFINLKPGVYQVRCQVLDGYVYYRVTGGALRVTGNSDTSRVTLHASPSVGAHCHVPFIAEDTGDLLNVEHGRALKNIDFRFAPFKKGTWKNYDTLDGLAHNCVGKIHRDPDGIMWFGTQGGGVSQYDGKEFVNFVPKDGLAGNIVWDIYRDPDCVMWFGATGGVSRYDGKEFTNLTTEDGLASDAVLAICGSTVAFPWNPASPIVEEYDTGFVPLQVPSAAHAKGKLATTWSEIKQHH